MVINTRIDKQDYEKAIKELQNSSGSSSGAGRPFNVLDYGAVGNGSTNDYAAIAAALADIYANKGGELLFPYTTNGYALGSSVVINPGQYAAGGGITVNLNGNQIKPSHTGWCFDVATNFFGANNTTSKVVSIIGGGATIQTTNLAAAGGIRITDCVRFVVRDLSNVNYNAGDGIRLFVSTTNLSTWCEFGLLSNVNSYACLNGVYAKCSSAASGGSFLGCQYEMITGNGTINNAKLFNLEGSHTNSVFLSCGGFYNQSSSTGGNGFYLNGQFQGCSFISSWIDLSGGTQGVATDIVFGANYTTNPAQYPMLVNSTWISLPTNWRTKLYVVGPFLTIGTAGVGTAMTGQAREMLAADRLYYVNSSTGSGGNNGLTSGSAFQTITQAMNAISVLDFNGFGIQVSLTGSFTEQVTIPITTGQIGVGKFTIDGNGSATITSATSSGGTIECGKGAQVNLQGMTISNTGASGARGLSIRGGRVIFGYGMTFGAVATGAQIFVNAGGFLDCSGQTITVTGNATQFALASFGGYISFFCTIAFGTRTYTTTFQAADGGEIEVNGSFTGTVTGTRSASTMNGIVETYTGNTAYLPGSVASTTATGGQYA